MYLHALLQKESGELAKEALTTIRDNNVGWAKNMRKILDSWEIDKEWDVITTTIKNALEKRSGKCDREKKSNHAVGRMYDQTERGREM